MQWIIASISTSGKDVRCMSGLPILAATNNYTIVVKIHKYYFRNLNIEGKVNGTKNQYSIV